MISYLRTCYTWGPLPRRTYKQSQWKLSMVKFWHYQETTYSLLLHQIQSQNTWNDCGNTPPGSYLHHSRITDQKGQKMFATAGNNQLCVYQERLYPTDTKPSVQRSLPVGSQHMSCSGSSVQWEGGDYSHTSLQTSSNSKWDISHWSTGIQPDTVVQ